MGEILRVCDIEFLFWTTLLIPSWSPTGVCRRWQLWLSHMGAIHATVFGLALGMPNYKFVMLYRVTYHTDSMHSDIYFTDVTCKRSAP